MPETNPYIAFFDLDRTITSKTSGRLLARRAYKKGLMSHSDLMRALWLSFAYRFSLKDPVKIVNEMAAWVKGITIEDFNSLADEIAEELLIPSIYRQALDEIKFHKDRNARTVILSSAPEYVCRKIAEVTGIEDVIGSVLEAKNGTLTGLSVRPLCYGREKEVRMTEYCEKNNTTPGKCWYYGDSTTDFFALSIAGHQVCVNPERKLKKAARKNGWKIVFWRRK